jgi:DNA gyrase subunit A
VIVFDTAEDVKVVSVERISEPEGEEGDMPPEASADGAPDTPPDSPSEE